MMYGAHDTIPENHKTVGAAAVELMSKGDQKQGVIDTQRAMMKDYVDELVKCAKDGAEKYAESKKPFYVCVQTRRERLLPNVIRNQFYHRVTRPTPEYDLALYHYDPKAEQLRFVWCVPDQGTVERMCEPGFIPQMGEEQLHYFAKSFRANTLI